MGRTPASETASPGDVDAASTRPTRRPPDNAGAHGDRQAGLPPSASAGLATGASGQRSRKASCAARSGTSR